MAQPQPHDRARTTITRAATLAAALVGLWFGFDFGQRIGGTVIGVVLAANGALFCSILVAAAVERLLRQRRDGDRT